MQYSTQSAGVGTERVPCINNNRASRILYKTRNRETMLPRCGIHLRRQENRQLPEKPCTTLHESQFANTGDIQAKFTK